MEIWTDTDFERMVACPKKVKEHFKKSSRNDRGTLKNEAVLVSDEFPNAEFKMFTRVLEAFPENFSVGLDYLSIGEKRLPLLRCNGKHNRIERAGGVKEHCEYHIHLMSAEVANSGSNRMPHAVGTEAYASFDQALAFFVEHVNIERGDRETYFPQTLDKTLSLFTDGGDKSES